MSEYLTQWTARESGGVRGIVGVGGLGHLAIQFAHAMGAEVTAISTTPNKAAEARQFGTHHFATSTDPEQMKKLGGSLDLLLSTAAANLDWSAYLAMLRPNGVFCILGVPEGSVVLPVLQMIFGQYTFAASVTGPPSEIEECSASPRCTTFGQPLRSFLWMK